MSAYCSHFSQGYYFIIARSCRGVPPSVLPRVIMLLMAPPGLGPLPATLVRREQRRRQAMRRRGTLPSCVHHDVSQAYVARVASAALAEARARQGTVSVDGLLPCARLPDDLDDGFSEALSDSSLIAEAVARTAVESMADVLL